MTANNDNSGSSGDNISQSSIHDDILMSVQELLESNHGVNMNAQSSADKGSTSSRGDVEVFIGQMSKIFNSGGQALADRLFKQMKWTGRSMYGMMGQHKKEPFDS